MNFKTIAILLSFGAVCSSAVYGMDDEQEKRLTQLKKNAEDIRRRNLPIIAQNNQKLAVLDAEMQTSLAQLQQLLRDSQKNYQSMTAMSQRHQQELDEICQKAESWRQETQRDQARLLEMVRNPAMSLPEKQAAIEEEKKRIEARRKAVWGKYGGANIEGLLSRPDIIEAYRFYKNNLTDEKAIEFIVTSQGCKWEELAANEKETVIASLRVRANLKEFMSQQAIREAYLYYKNILSHEKAVEFILTSQGYKWEAFTASTKTWVINSFRSLN